MIRKYHNHKPQTTPRHREEEPLNHPTRHQEDKLSKATSSLFPIKMTAILELTLSNVRRNIEQLQTPTIFTTKRSQHQQNGQQPKPPGGGLKCILLEPNLRPRFCSCIRPSSPVRQDGERRTTFFGRVCFPPCPFFLVLAHFSLALPVIFNLLIQSQIMLVSIDRPSQGVKTMKNNALL